MHKILPMLNEKKDLSERDEMIRVLILAYDFPPYISVASLRPYSWYKYFSDYNIYPIVVTRQWNCKYKNKLDYVAPGFSDKAIIEETTKGTIIHAPYKPNIANKILLKYGDKKFVFFRKLITAFYEIFQFVFPIGPKSIIYKTASNYLQKNHVDVIIATGDPFVLFYYAKKLSKKFKIPWIADYRDLWTRELIKLQNKVLDRFYRIFEMMIVREALFITTTAETFILFIQKKFRKSVHVILNGFMDDEFPIKQNHQKNKFFTVAFAGTLYKFDPVERIFEIFDKFVNHPHEKHFYLQFIGINNEIELKNILHEKYPKLKQYVQFLPKMTYPEVLQYLSKAHILLLFSYYLYPGTKIYDYLYVKNKILLCFRNDPVANDLRKKYFKKMPCYIKLTPQEKILKETQAGEVIENGDHLYQRLLELYDEFMQTGDVISQTTNIEKYSRRYQALVFSNLIKMYIQKLKVKNKEL